MLFGVDGIAKNGGADVLEVNTDLVGATGVEVAKDEGGFGGLIRGDDFVIGDRSFSGWRRDHGHFLAIHRMSANVSEDRVFGFQWNTISDSEVDFLHCRALGKLGGEALVGGVGFCNDEAAGGVFIESVHDTGSLHSAYPGEFSSAMMEQCVDEGAVGISGSGMDDHAVGFVEDDKVFVFEKDIERDVLWAGDVWNCLGDDDGNFIARMDAVTGFGGFAVEQDKLLANEILNSGAGKI